MASISKVSICNVALAQLGANLINSLSEGSAEATLCNAFFDQARTTVLSMHPWNFAIKRTELAPDFAAPLYEFAHQFTLPADCLRVLRVDMDGDYRIEGRKIVTDRPTCFLKYIKDEQDVSAWSQGFVNAMTARLRFDLSYPITKSSSETAAAMRLLEMAMQAARAVDASEDISEELGSFDNTFVTVRR